MDQVGYSGFQQLPGCLMKMLKVVQEYGTIGIMIIIIDVTVIVYYCCCY